MSERTKVENALRRLRTIGTMLTVAADEVVEVEGSLIGHGFSGGGNDRVDDVTRVLALKRDIGTVMAEVLATNEHLAGRLATLTKDEE